MSYSDLISHEQTKTYLAEIGMAALEKEKQQMLVEMAVRHACSTHVLASQRLALVLKEMETEKMTTKGKRPVNKTIFADIAAAEIGVRTRSGSSSHLQNEAIVDY